MWYYVILSSLLKTNYFVHRIFNCYRLHLTTHICKIIRIFHLYVTSRFFTCSIRCFIFCQLTGMTKNELNSVQNASCRLTNIYIYVEWRKEDRRRERPKGSKIERKRVDKRKRGWQLRGLAGKVGFFSTKTWPFPLNLLFSWKKRCFRRYCWNLLNVFVVTIARVS